MTETRLAAGKIPVHVERVGARTLPGIAAPSSCPPEVSAACELRFLRALNDRDRAFGVRLENIEREIAQLREDLSRAIPLRKPSTTPPNGTVELTAGPVKARGTLRQLVVLVVVASLVGGAAYVLGSWGPPSQRAAQPAQKASP